MKACSCQNHSIHTDFYYTLLFSPFPSSDVHLQTEYCVTYFKVITIFYEDAALTVLLFF